MIMPATMQLLINNGHHATGTSLTLHCNIDFFYHINKVAFGEIDHKLNTDNVFMAQVY